MIKSIKIKGNSIYKDRFLTNEFNLYSKYNFLYGCNGSGKSTLIELLNDKKLREENLEIDGEFNNVACFINSADNCTRKKISIFQDDKTFLQECSEKIHIGSKSEGQAIIYSAIHNFLYSEKVKNADLILIDEIDSGLSIDNINIICNLLQDICKNKQVIVACNNYHFAYNSKKIINMLTGNKDTVNNYEEFVNKIINIRVAYEDRQN